MGSRPLIEPTGREWCGNAYDLIHQDKATVPMQNIGKARGRQDSNTPQVFVGDEEATWTTCSGKAGAPIG